MNSLRWINVVLVGLVAARVAAAVWAAIFNVKGDYYASLPGAYVRTVNPTLWNSPDMQGAWGYQLDTYFHGPTQYLTLYPLAYLDSYADIARVLLPIYAVVLALAFWCMRRALVQLTGSARLTIPLLASTFLFFPLIQAFIQREFEVIVFLGLSAALWMLLRDRRDAAAALLAYVAWFKYVPLLFAGYLGLRRWFRALAVFALFSVATVVITEVVFGLELFVNNNVPGHAAQVFNLWSFGFEPGAHGYMYGTGFCYGWIEIETTLANVRHGLCSLAFNAPWLAPHIVYIGLCLAIAAVYLVTHAALERVGVMSGGLEGWRRAIEFSIVTTVYACFFFNHYYYLIVLIIPLNVLLARYLTTNRAGLISAWAVAYALISAFVVPTSVLTRLSGQDVWAWYISGAWFMWGELLLVALLLWEYRAVARAVSQPARNAVPTATFQNSIA